MIVPILLVVGFIHILARNNNYNINTSTNPEFDVRVRRDVHNHNFKRDTNTKDTAEGYRNAKDTKPVDSIVSDNSVGVVYLEGENISDTAEVYGNAKDTKQGDSFVSDNSADFNLGDKNANKEFDTVRNESREKILTPTEFNKKNVDSTKQDYEIEIPTLSQEDNLRKPIDSGVKREMGFLKKLTPKEFNRKSYVSTKKGIEINSLEGDIDIKGDTKSDTRRFQRDTQETLHSGWKTKPNFFKRAYLAVTHSFDYFTTTPTPHRYSYYNGMYNDNYNNGNNQNTDVHYQSSAYTNQMASKTLNTGNSGFNENYNSYNDRRIPYTGRSYSNVPTYKPTNSFNITTYDTNNDRYELPYNGNNYRNDPSIYQQTNNFNVTTYNVNRNRQPVPYNDNTYNYMSTANQPSYINITAYNSNNGRFSNNGNTYYNNAPYTPNYSFNATYNANNDRYLPQNSNTYYNNAPLPYQSNYTVNVTTYNTNNDRLPLPRNGNTYHNNVPLPYNSNTYYNNPVRPYQPINNYNATIYNWNNDRYPLPYNGNRYYNNLPSTYQTNNLQFTYSFNPTPYNDGYNTFNNTNYPYPAPNYDLSPNTDKIPKNTSNDKNGHNVNPTPNDSGYNSFNNRNYPYPSPNNGMPRSNDKIPENSGNDRNDNNGATRKIRTTTERIEIATSCILCATFSCAGNQKRVGFTCQDVNYDDDDDDDYINRN